MYIGPGDQHGLSSYDLHVWARRERNRYLGHLIRAAVRWSASSLARLGSWIAIEPTRRYQAHLLAALDDRTLADIGIRRGEIPAFVRAELARRGRR